MRAHFRTALGLSALFLSTASHAIKVPLPADSGLTANIGFQLQTQALLNENGSPDGTKVSTDFFVRRSRLVVNGDYKNNFSYLIQFDNPNFGKNGNFTNRALIQDMWVGWAPTGITGGTVVYIDAGLLLLPISRHFLQSTTSFTTADIHSDSLRGVVNQSAFRDVGLSVRGWTLDKKIGFRGGVYEGARGTPQTKPTDPVPQNPSATPRLSGMLNVDVLGSEEGGWLYQGIYFTKQPILSLNVGGVYQSQIVRGPVGLTDNLVGSAGVFLDMPVQGETSELVFQFEGYRNSNGTGSRDTGYGFFTDLGFRYGFVQPYVSYEYFGADDCPSDGSLGAACTAHLADSRNMRAGLDFFFNKNLNHINVEFALNRGQSAYGSQSVTPAVPGATNSLGATATKSVLVHWNVNF